MYYNCQYCEGVDFFEIRTVNLCIPYVVLFIRYWSADKVKGFSWHCIVCTVFLLALYATYNAQGSLRAKYNIYSYIQNISTLPYIRDRQPTLNKQTRTP